MPSDDLYGLLGVSRDATPDELRKAYRKRARKYHPDVNPNDPKAEDRFKEVSFAHEVLSDPERRRLYDEFGADGIKQGFSPDQARAYESWQRGARRSPHQGGFASEFDLDDLFGSLFGARRGRAGPRAGASTRGEIQVDFMDAVRGGEVRVQVAGAGTLRVKIPAGSDEGTRIRLAGQGSAGISGGPAGDLVLELHVRPHAFFSRDAADLSIDLPVTLPELVRGASVEVPTPDGPVTMTIPPNSTHGQRLRLRGKGVLRRDGGGERGELYVRLELALPDASDPRLEKIAGEMDALYEGVDVRARLKDET
jgi:curved DNA-binding protein